MTSGWTRFKQSTRETFKPGNKDDKTEIPLDIQNLLLKAEGVVKLYNDLIARTVTYFPEAKLKTKNAHDPTQAQPLAQFGTGMELLAAAYPQDPAAGQFLTSVQSTLMSLARAKAELDAVALQQFIEPKRDLLVQNIQQAQSHYDKLKTRRLELDAKKHALKQERKSASEDGSKLKKYELDVESAQSRFDAEVDAIRELLAPVVNDEEMLQQQCQQSAIVLSSMKNYFRESLQLLEALDAKTDLQQWQTYSRVGRAQVQARTGGTRESSAPFLRGPSSGASGAATPLHRAPSTPSTRMAAVGGSPPTQKPAPPLLAAKPSPSIGAASLSRGSGGGIAARQQALLQQLSGASQPQSEPSLGTKPLRKQFRALYDFQPQQPSDLGLRRGDLLELLDAQQGEWWKGRNLNSGESGLFPSNYVEKV